MYENLRTSRIIINNDQSLDDITLKNRRLDDENPQGTENS